MKSLIKTECGIKKYEQLRKETSPIKRLRFFWFVFFAALRDLTKKEKYLAYFLFLIKGKRKRTIKIETGMKNSGCEITDKSGVPPLKEESIEEPI